MRVRLRNPDRVVDVPGRRRVSELLDELSIDPDTVLVIRDRTLLTREQAVGEDDEIEVRPVISGNSFLVEYASLADRISVVPQPPLRRSL